MHLTEKPGKGSAEDKALTDEHPGPDPIESVMIENGLDWGSQGHVCVECGADISLLLMARTVALELTDVCLPWCRAMPHLISPAQRRAPFLQSTWAYHTTWQLIYSLEDRQEDDGHDNNFVIDEPYLAWLWDIQAVSSLTGNCTFCHTLTWLQQQGWTTPLLDASFFFFGKCAWVSVHAYLVKVALWRPGGCKEIQKEALFEAVFKHFNDILLSRRGKPRSVSKDLTNETFSVSIFCSWV